MYFVNFPVSNVQSIVSNVWFPISNVLFTVFNVRFQTSNVPFPVSNVPFPVSNVLYVISKILFQVFNVQFPVSYVLFPVSNVLFPVFNVRFQTSNVTFLVSNVLFPVSNVQFLVSNVRFRASNVKFPVSNVLIPVSNVMFVLSNVLFQTSNVLFPVSYVCFPLSNVLSSFYIVIVRWFLSFLVSCYSSASISGSQMGMSASNSSGAMETPSANEEKPKTYVVSWPMTYSFRFLFSLVWPGWPARFGWAVRMLLRARSRWSMKLGNMDRLSSGTIIFRTEVSPFWRRHLWLGHGITMTSYMCRGSTPASERVPVRTVFFSSKFHVIFIVSSVIQFCAHTTHIRKHAEP